MTNVVTPGLAVTYRFWQDDEVQIVWAKAGGIWGLAHVTKDIVDDNFVPRNRKPKPIPKPAAMGTALSKHQDPV